jgi:hypothetical protein
MARHTLDESVQAGLVAFWQTVIAQQPQLEGELQVQQTAALSAAARRVVRELTAVEITDEDIRVALDLGTMSFWSSVQAAIPRLGIVETVEAEDLAFQKTALTILYRVLRDRGLLPEDEV